MKRQDKKAEIELINKLVETQSYDFELGRKPREKQLQLLQLEVPQGQLILDAGCGPGTYGIILAEQGNEVIGVDLSVKATGEAKERARKKGVSFSPLVGDLERLPFKGNSFNICFCGFTLHHFPDINAIVAEFARVVRPRGKVILLEPNGSNLAVRLSNRLENLVRGWLFRMGIDTPNEVNYRHNVYTETLGHQGFIDIKVASSYTGGLPPLPTKFQKRGLDFLSLLLIHILARLRRLFYVITVKVLTRPLNGIDLMITGTKGE